MGEIAITGEVSPDYTPQLETHEGEISSNYTPQLESREDGMSQDDTSSMNDHESGNSLKCALKRKSSKKCHISPKCDSLEPRNLRICCTESEGDNIFPPISKCRKNSLPVFKRSLSEACWSESRRRVNSTSSTSSDSVIFTPEFLHPSLDHQVSLSLAVGSLSPLQPSSLEPQRAHSLHVLDEWKSRTLRKTLEDAPQDLSRHRRPQHPLDYPAELHLNLRSRAEGTVQGMMEIVELRERETKENQQGRSDKRERGRGEKNSATKGIKREHDESLGADCLTEDEGDTTPDVLQHHIMVAETVKSYPVNYPALIPLSPSVAGLGPYNPCSPSLIHANYSSPHIMDQKPAQQQQQQQQQQQLQGGQGPQLGGPHNGQDTPVGLGAPGLNLPSTLDLAQLRKKEIFAQRKQREFIPDSKKDDSYWDRRRRNNEAAKRSREKRRFNDMILEQRVIELSKENHILKAQLTAIKEKYGILGETLVNTDQVLASMPQSEQILALNKRTKFSQALITLNSSPSVTSLLSPRESCDGSPATPSYHGQQEPESSPAHYSHYPSHSQMDDQESTYDADQQFTSSDSNLYYGQSALNLSSRASSHSPHSPATSHMDFSPSDPELSRRSPEAPGMSLPHKLRHKSHLGDKDAAQSLLALQAIKSEPSEHQQEAAEDSVGSSDERDSAIGYSSSSSCSDYNRASDNNSSPPTACSLPDSSSSQQPLSVAHYHQQHLHHHHQHHHHQQQQQQTHHHHHQTQHQQTQQQQEQQGEGEQVLEFENTHLRSELERLATEVATLKYMLVRRPRSEGDSDGSR